MFGCYHSPSGYCLCKTVEKDIKIDSHIEEVHKCTIIGVIKGTRKQFSNTFKAQSTLAIKMIPGCDALGPLKILATFS